MYRIEAMYGRLDYYVNFYNKREIYFCNWIV